jgi:hypothetical protein
VIILVLCVNPKPLGFHLCGHSGKGRIRTESCLSHAYAGVFCISSLKCLFRRIPDAHSDPSRTLILIDPSPLLMRVIPLPTAFISNNPHFVVHP